MLIRGESYFAIACRACGARTASAVVKDDEIELICDQCHVTMARIEVEVEALDFF